MNTNHRIVATLAALSRNEEHVMAPFHAAQAATAQKTATRMREYSKERRKSDCAFRVLQVLRCRLGAALRARDIPKVRTLGTSATKRMLGCSVEYLMDYIAVFFEPGMSWENYGEWELDHVKPCRAFNLLDRDERNRCFHYTNLQPIWMRDNRRKSDKWKGICARTKPHAI